jgi:hypothetical protein
MADAAAVATPTNMQLGLALINPRFAYRQAVAQQQQQLAQQLTAQGNEPTDYARLANPGGFVVPVSPVAEAAKAIKSGLGGYLSGKAIGAQLDAYKSFQNGGAGPVGGASLGGGVTGDPFNPTDLAAALANPEGYKASLALKNAGPLRAAETANTPYQTPQGTYTMGSKIMGGMNTPSPTAATAQPQATVAPPIKTEEAQPDTGNAMPNAIPGTTPGVEKSPLAADGKTLLPDLTAIPKPDPSGTPKFNTENTKTGVEQTIQDQKDAAEGNKAFAATAQSLGQEKARLDNLIQVYKDVQSGTLTAQNPEFFNKMAALGFHDDPQSIKDLAGIQNATQNHILQVIQQIKDTNANAGGGAPTRTFGSEISQLLENGESTKGQPEALWNVIGQAKGVVDHHLDMVNGWMTAGGLGNRLAGGYTMRPDDFATKFSTHHNITDYRDRALKDMGPFKGMAGNNNAKPSTKVIDGVTYTNINGVWHQ